MPNHKPPLWSFYIDRGGTFTDVVAYSPNGKQHSLKLLSQDKRYEDPVIEGIRRVMGLSSNVPLPTTQIHSVHVGTTLATNALLERKGARVLWLSHLGFKDALTIGHQNRLHLFERHPKTPPPLYETVAEIGGRVNAKGELIEPLDIGGLNACFEQARQAGLESLAVCTFHAVTHPNLEQTIHELAEPFEFSNISLSHQISPLIGWVDRAHTTLVDAYLSPIIGRYARSLNQALNPPGCKHCVILRFIKSDGGLAQYDHLKGHQSLLSGPAAGLVGCLETARLSGFQRVIAFDMGGTSTDVSYLTEGYEKVMSTAIDEMNLNTPTLDIQTIASGGGSCIHFDGQRLVVGPESAGASPGPACYRLGGPLTITDCNVFLGRLVADDLPHEFGPTGDQPIDRVPPQQLIEALSHQIERQLGQHMEPEEVAQGCLDIAVSQMANAIKKVSTQRGHDVSKTVLNCFGGAGGQHALFVAQALDMTHVLVHPLSGVLSAVGLSLAQPSESHEFSIEASLDALTDHQLDVLFDHAKATATAELIAQGFDRHAVEHSEKLILCYQGSDTRLTLNRLPIADLRHAFDERHESLYGMRRPDASIQIILGLVEAKIRSNPEAPVDELSTIGSSPQSLSTRTTEVYLNGQWEEIPIVNDQHVPIEGKMTGPALITTPHATLVVLENWSVSRNNSGVLSLVREKSPARPPGLKSKTGQEVEWDRPSDPEPIKLEIFNGLFGSVTERMGTVLSQTAWSTNIKERRDFSCALFNAKGELIANAPHVPVHLGSMGASVQAVIERFGPEIRPGDAYLLNDPFHGGTHLPDLTVMRPAFNLSGRLLYWVANRAHHADVGGSTPGSMPPNSTEITSEGILFAPTRIMQGDQLDESHFLHSLGKEPYPARNPTQNLADLRAQCAANAAGEQAMAEVMAQMGEQVSLQYMEHVLALGEEKTLTALQPLLPDEPKHYCITMDHGDRVCVTIQRQCHGRLLIDFSQTSPQSLRNFNAPAAITRACVLYVLRCLVAEDMPLNDGCLRAVEIVIPKGSLLNPDYPAAVVAGNVETSQVITDALLGALGIMANGPGTMNNLTFGTHEYQHYETLCGGGGASALGPGSQGKHVHMTNSRLTDAEILETRFPVLLNSFGFRQGSGGKGLHAGGEGVVRVIQFLEPMQVSLLGNSRKNRPSGLAGGGAGQCGLNELRDRDGHVHRLPGCISFDVAGGEQLIVSTPGGGGYGSLELPD